MLWVLLTGGAALSAEGFVEGHLVRDQCLRRYGGGRDAGTVLRVEERRLLVLVSLTSSHVGRSRLDVFVDGGWVRLLSLWLVLVPLRVH